MLMTQRSLHPVLSGCLCTVRGTHFARSVAFSRFTLLPFLQQRQSYNAVITLL